MSNKITPTAVDAAARRICQMFLANTGGEPLLQLDASLIEAVRQEGFDIAVETNGTLLPAAQLDWVCVSPKAGAELKLIEGDELKIVYPQAGLDAAALLEHRFTHFWLQPMDGANRAENTTKAAAFCQENPPWRLSLQTHKLIGIP